jgi:lysophospholipase L1-like esterase
VSDAKARTASCTFNVVVQPPPKLSLTRFLAFGDSITAGEIVGEGIVVQGIGVVRPLLVDPFLAYPADLTRNLAIRYSSQQPFVENVGRSGETTAQGVARLPTELSAANAPQVLLLLEGANDIGNGDPATVNPGVQNMDAMVRIGKSRGLRVFVGTLPPQNPNACTGANVPAGCVFRAGGAGNVVPFNNGLKAMAAVENVPLVDVYTAFNGDVTTLIDFDGLHPTANGYQVIANAFSAAIKQNLETAATTTVFTRPSFVRPGPR